MVIISLVKVVFCLVPKGTLPLLVVPKLACFVLFKALNLTICILFPLFASVFVIAATLEVVAVEVVVETVGNRLLLVKVLFVTKVLLAPRLNFFFLFVGGGSPRSSRSLKLT